MMNTHAETLEDYTLPDLVFQDPEAVRSLQDRLLGKMMNLVSTNHPYYSQLMASAGLNPADFSTISALEDFPLTSKADFLHDPEMFRLRSDGLPLDERIVAQVFYTTGTTSGVPAAIYNTSFDRNAFLHHCTTRAEITGLRSDDVIMNLFPLTQFPTGGYCRLVDDAAALGAALVFGHTGHATGPFPVRRSTTEVIRLIEQHCATVLWGVPGYIRRLLITAQEIGADLSSVRTLMLTGEAVTPATATELADRLRSWGCIEPKIVNRYASTEAGTSMVECKPGTGLHDLSPDLVYLEAVDLATGKRVPDGQQGALAITHLARRGTVLLRYCVGDDVVLDHSVCPQCHRTSVRIVDGPSRSGALVKIKGMLVNLTAVGQVLASDRDIIEYQVRVTTENRGGQVIPGAGLLLRVAPATTVDTTALVTNITEAVRAVAFVTPSIEITERDQIFDPDAEFKARRIVVE